MKVAYNYVIFRYIHDIVTGEFVNIGVVILAPSANYIESKFTTKYLRLKKMFLNVNSRHCSKMINYINKRIIKEKELLANGLHLEKTPEKVSDLVSKILPKDDSSLAISDEKYGVTENLQEMIEYLFERYVEKYNEKKDRHSRSDNDIWQIYKKYFEENNISNKLKPHRFYGQYYDHEFKYCTKNGKWHIQQPISFDFKKKEQIFDKANIWFGRITSLLGGSEKFKINMLIGIPSDLNLHDAVTKASNILEKIDCEHTIVKESDAAEFAKQLKSEIETHEQ